MTFAAFALPLALLLPFPPDGQAAHAPVAPPLFSEGLQASPFQGNGSWRDWLLPEPPPAIRRRPGRARLPSATVEVVDWMPPPETREVRARSFAFRLLPELQQSFRFGLDSGATKQMLSEFMSMDPRRIGPPTVPSVFYNTYTALLLELRQRERMLKPGTLRPLP